MPNAEIGGTPQSRKGRSFDGTSHREAGKVHPITPANKEGTIAEEKGFNDQLDRFLGSSEYLSRRWLHDNNLNVYVRRNERLYGKPKAGLGIVGEDAVLSRAECLEVADVQFKGDSLQKAPTDNPAVLTASDRSAWESFVDNAVAASKKHGLELLHVEDVTDPRLLNWFKDKIAQADPEDSTAWQSPREYAIGEDERRQSFFRWI